MIGSGTNLFLGRSLYNRFQYLELPGQTGMLTLGQARSGKGAAASIPNLLYWPHSAVVIDLKGTHYAVTHARRRQLKNQVYAVDPFHVRTAGHSFNPLARLNPDAPEIREQIGVIADGIVVPTVGAHDPHWDDGARTIIGGFIGHAITSPNYRNPSLPLIRDMLSLSSDEQIRLWAEMSLNSGAAGIAKETAARIIRGIETNEILGLLSNADKHTEFLSSPPIRDALSSGTFSFAEMRTRPTTIYIVIPPHYVEQHKRFLRLFLNLAINEMSIGGRSETPVLLLADELLHCGFMTQVLKAYGLLQGYNLIPWAFVQDWGSLVELYGKSANAFVNNSRAVQAFAISDAETTDFVSARIGERSMAYVAGVRDGARMPRLRTGAEVARDVAADTDLQYVLEPGKPPHLLRKVRYYEDRRWWKEDALLPAWFMRRFYPFWRTYAQDPDFTQHASQPLTTPSYA